MSELAEKIKKEILEEIQNNPQLKKKKFKLPSKGRVSNSKSKKGYVSILRIDEAKNVTFERQQIEGSTYRSNEGEYHAIEEDSPLTHKGKPFLIQVSKKILPYNVTRDGQNLTKGDNETFGQRYIMARMLGDSIKIKKKATGLLLIVGLIVAGLIGYNVFMG